MKRTNKSPLTSGKRVKFEVFPAESDNEDELEERKECGKKNREEYNSDESNSDSDQESNEEEDQDEKDEDEDMFAERKEAKSKFMKSGEIEGQTWGQSMDDGDIESFNMDKELDEGNFTQTGIYIKNVDKHKIHDTWMQDVDVHEMERARVAHEKIVKDSIRKETHHQTPKEIIREVLSILEPNENILKAIKRLASTASLPKWKKAKKGAIVVSPEEAASNKGKLDRLTGLTTLLLESDLDVYEKTYQELLTASK